MDAEDHIKSATGKSWQEWFWLLKSIKAEELEHKQIVVGLVKRTNVNSYWAQMLTIKFEQEIGRRAKDQV